MRRRLVSTLSLTAAMSGIVAVSAPAVAAGSQHQQANGRGVNVSLTTDDGTSITFLASEATNHSAGGAPTSASNLWVERVRMTCDVGEYPDGTNTCVTTYARMNVFPLSGLDIGPALSSADLPAISAPFTKSECTYGPEWSYDCVESSGVTGVSAHFTATGPLDNAIYQYRSEYEGCRSTMLSSSQGRPADGTISFLGSTYSTTALIGHDVGMQRRC